MVFTVVTRSISDNKINKTKVTQSGSALFRAMGKLGTLEIFWKRRFNVFAEQIMQMSPPPKKNLHSVAKSLPGMSFTKKASLSAGFKRFLLC